MNLDVDKKAVVYTRVSSREQVENFSLGSQKEACEKLAKAQRLTIAKYFTDEGVSAKNTNRQGLQDLLIYCSKKSNKVSAVIVYNFSRLNRNTGDFLSIKALLAKYGVVLISTQEPSGSDTPVERAVQTILSAVNQLDNETKAINVATNMEKRFMEGYPLTRPRIGYKTAIIEGRKEHIPDPEWFEIIKTMWFRIRDEKLTLGQVKKELNGLGRKKFSIQYVSKMFSSKFYCGYNVSPKYGEVLGKHIPMIDEDTFYQVRYLITGRKQAIKDKQYVREDFPLKGLLICSDCDRKLTASWSKGKNKRYAYYACSRRGLHPVKSYSKDNLEEQFIKLVESIKPSKKLTEVVKRLLVEKYNAKWGLLNQNLERLKVDIRKLEDKKRFILEKHASGIYSDEEYMTLKEQLEIEYLTKKGMISEGNLDQIDIEAIVNAVNNLLTNLDSVWINSNTTTKLALGCSMFPKGIVIEDGKVRTPELGSIYKLNEDFVLQNNYSTPNNTEFEHLIDQYLDIYKRFISEASNIAI